MIFIELLLKIYYREEFLLNKLTDIVLLKDIVSLPKEILQEVATNLDIPEHQASGQLAVEIWDSIEKDTSKKDKILNDIKHIILSGRTSVTWYSLDEGQDLLGAKDKIIENCGFNPFEQIVLPQPEELTNEPIIIGGALCNSKEYFLRLMYKSGVTQFFQGATLSKHTTSDIKTVYINEDHNCVEVRTDARTANKFARCIAKLLNKEISLTQTDVLAPYGNDIEKIVDKLKGELIDATGKPEIILESLGDEQAEAIQDIIAALNMYFESNDIVQLGHELENAKQKFGDNLISIPFDALILCGLEKIGFGVTDTDLRKLPAYNVFRPHVQNQGGFIRFTINEDGIKNAYTIRVGLNTKSIYFMTPASEAAIKYVRERIIY